MSWFRGGEAKSEESSQAELNDMVRRQKERIALEHPCTWEGSTIEDDLGKQYVVGKLNDVPTNGDATLLIYHSHGRGHDPSEKEIEYGVVEVSSQFKLITAGLTPRRILDGRPWTTLWRSGEYLLRFSCGGQLWISRIVRIEGKSWTVETTVEEARRFFGTRELFGQMLGEIQCYVRVNTEQIVARITQRECL